MSLRRAVGIGCTSLAAIEDVLDLVRAVIGKAEGVAILASLDRRETIARAAAACLDLDLMLFSAGRLAEVRGIITPSARAANALGTASVAEAAALAALGPRAQLIVARRTGRRCTCALAEIA